MGGYTKRLRKTWLGMKYRCFSEKCKAYKNYGARGIIVCEEWMEYDTFKDWAMAHGYNENMTIDRIDSSKGYNPSNCQWLTKTDNTARSNMDNPRNVKSYKVEDPHGKIYIVNNMSEFCRGTELNAGVMRSVARGEKKSHKQWKCEFY